MICPNDRWSHPVSRHGWGNSPTTWKPACTPTLRTMAGWSRRMRLRGTTESTRTIAPRWYSVLSWEMITMSWLPMYLDESDVEVLASWLNDQNELAFIVAAEEKRRKAVSRLDRFPDGDYQLW